MYAQLCPLSANESVALTQYVQVVDPEVGHDATIKGVSFQHQFTISHSLSRQVITIKQRHCVGVLAVL